MVNLKYTCTLAVIFLMAMSALVSAEEMNEESLIMLSGSMENTTRIFPTVVKTLYAGQHIEVGSVTVSSDIDNLTIKYETIDNWTLKATHLHVADSFEGIPAVNGNPVVGKFTYKSEDLSCGTTTVTYVVPISNENITLFIAAHADVSYKNNDKEANKKNKDKDAKGDEGAWAEGIAFAGNNWATYFTYDIAELVEDEEGGDNEGEGEDNQGEGDENEGIGEDNQGEGDENEGEGEDNQGEGDENEGKGEDNEGEGDENEGEGGDDDRKETEDDTGKNKSSSSSSSGRMMPPSAAKSTDNDSVYMSADIEEEEQPPMMSMPEPVYEEEDQGPLTAIFEKGRGFLWVVIAMLLSGIWIMSGYGLTFH